MLGRRSLGFAASHSPAEPLPLCSHPAEPLSPQHPPSPAARSGSAHASPSAHDPGARCTSRPKQSWEPVGTEAAGTEPEAHPCPPPTQLLQTPADNPQNRCTAPGRARLLADADTPRAPGWLRASLLLQPRGRAGLLCQQRGCKKQSPGRLPRRSRGQGCSRTPGQPCPTQGAPTHARLPFGTAASEQSPDRLRCSWRPACSPGH